MSDYIEETMSKEFSDKLTEYLDSECGDYGLSYKWKWCEDLNWCEVIITSDMSRNIAEINFRYNKKSSDLEIELSEDSFYITREYDWSVKYFWMLVAPKLFNNY